MLYNSVTLRYAAGIATVALGGTVLYLSLRNKFKRRYVKVGKVSKLLFYPIKAFAAEELQTAEFTKSGVKVGIIEDRMWSVIDEKGYHVDQKEVPRFVLLHAKLRDDKMCIDGPDMETLKLKVFDKIPEDANIVKCNVFGTFIETLDCGDEAAKWIQKFSGKPGLRLVQYVRGLTLRPSDMKGLCKLNGERYPILFQGKQPYHILSEASVEDLNSKVEEKVTYLNFRPNVVVSGCKAYDEDKWKYMKIGESATLVRTIRNSRCAIVITNTETGKMKGTQPLATLRKYRKAMDPKEREVYKHSPLFGLFYVLEVEGKVSVGDDVYAVYE